MKLTQLLKSWVKKHELDCDIKDIKNDSRAVQAGDLFLAYPGAATDGRLYIEKALAAGAAAIAYEPNHFPPVVELPLTIPCIPINNLANN